MADEEKPQVEAGEDSAGEGRGKRKKRDPFKGMPRVYSQDAAINSKQLTNLSQMKKIKSARVRHAGKQVVTDDVKKLKSLAIEPRLPEGEFVNYYVEPIKIEYYIPKESRFAVETKYLYIPLVDPEPGEFHDILRQFTEEDRFIDLITVMNEFPQYITDILESYNNSMTMLESLSQFIIEADGGEEDNYRTAFYLVEALAEKEPTLASTEFLGAFQAWNLNWLVRRMNALGVEFNATDKTVSYFIKLRNIYWEESNFDYDERFEILAALFYEQAFPHRQTSYKDDDYIFGAF